MSDEKPSGAPEPSEVTQLLHSIQQGNSAGTEQLLSLVYNELRRVAAHKLASEKPGQTLQATALVHEAYLRLVGSNAQSSWNSRGHFFAAAAEAMRRILVEQARRKSAQKRGGHLQRVELSDLADEIDDDEKMLQLEEALAKLEQEDRRKAHLVKLRFFAGLTSAQAATLLDISETTADRDWAFSRAWLQQEMQSDA